MLNADDPLVRHMAQQTSARAWYFGLETDVVGSATTLREGRVVVMGRSAGEDLGAVADMPITIGDTLASTWPTCWRPHRVRWLWGSGAACA